MFGLNLNLERLLQRSAARQASFDPPKRLKRRFIASRLRAILLLVVVSLRLYRKQLLHRSFPEGGST
jgi:hypothetical protein